MNFNSYLCARKTKNKMKGLYWFIALGLVVLAQYSCGSQDKTYAEQKKHEREVVNSFINRHVVMKIGNDTLLDLGKINVISEEQFMNQDSTTNVAKNEFVLFANTGIYMQIVREGTGKRIESGENKRLICRFWEYNIMGDSLQLSNRVQAYAARPEFLNVSNNSGYFSGSFDTTMPTGSLFFEVYSETDIPDGWLKPMSYIRVGNQVDANRIAKVRVIVPHSSGHTHAMASVYPCFYELTFQEL